MKARKPLQLEALLDHLGDDIPEDSTHRYALRRALLSSQYFEHGKSRVSHMVAVVNTMLIGGVSVALVAFVAVNLLPVQSTTEFVQYGPYSVAVLDERADETEPTQQVRTPIAVKVDTLPAAQLADFQTQIPVQDFIQSIQLPAVDFAVAR